jgi:hypothetical protein
MSEQMKEGVESGLKPVTNCWTIYTTTEPGQPAISEIGRPQDWGDPKWMYRVYVLEAQGYRNKVHCWIDQQMSEADHLKIFGFLVVFISLPGWNPKLSGREYLAQDDFWSNAWGEVPPEYNPDEE